LAAEIDFAALADKQVLIVRGTTGREFLADAFRSRGIHVTQLAAYRRSAPEFSISVKRRLEQLLQSENDWVITSSEALRTLIFWCEQLTLDDAVAKSNINTLSFPTSVLPKQRRQWGFIPSL
jgi:uroporphyrinogen-III synthase